MVLPLCQVKPFRTFNALGGPKPAVPRVYAAAYEFSADAWETAGFRISLHERAFAIRRTMPTTRRLAAILAADVTGYSRLMGADEEGTHERVKAHLRELLDPKISEHNGRIVKNTGDGVLAEFASVIDAVRCAGEIQVGMADRNAGIPTDQHITFRIGINIGDVIIECDDIYGEGVN